MSNRADHVGQKLRRNKNNATRILLANIGGLIGEKVYFKRDKLKHLFIKFGIDILSLTELGQNLRRIDNSEQLRELTRGWVENIAVRSTYNRHYDSGRKRQYGGTALVIGNQLSSRLASSDIDPTGLGRWSSTLIQGKIGYKTRVISAYRPCLGTSEGSVNIQHHLFFADPSVDPRTQFLTDLADQICAWQDQGEQIILTGDMNTGDLTSETSMNRFWEQFLRRTGLVDAHKQHLNCSWLPNTHNRGRTQIDFIFISPSIKIKRAGFLPFEKIPSDHRGIWIDVDTPSILGLNPPVPPTVKARRLKLIDPRIVSRYQSLLLQSVSANNFIQRIENLRRVDKEEWNLEHTQEYQEVAHLYRSQMLRAEAKCRKIHTGAHPWSPALEKARKTVFLWDLVVKQGRGMSVPVKKIQQLSKKLSITDTRCSMSRALLNLKESMVQYKKIKKRSKSLRQTYLESLAEALAEANKTKKSSHIRELINRERLRETFRKIKAARGLYSNRNLSSVTVIDQSSGEQFTYTERSQVEDQIILNNKKKFMQTQGQCPLMKGSFRQSLGTRADTPSARAVIAGEYEPPDRCRSSVKEFLAACEKPNDFQSTIEHHLSLDQYRKKWAKAKERTSAGMAHFGMWKAGARHDILGQLEWVLSTLPIIHGFSPDVWKSATDVMILKASGKTDLDSLRTVVLYEADFNFMNKQIGRAAVENASNNDQMAVEQFAKSGSSPIQQCICRRIVFDLVRFQKSALVMCSSDLLSCYDRIVHSAASLAMQRFGIPLETMSSMLSTIQNCLHNVRTGLGTSDKTYGGVTAGEDPLMGVGQGNGAGPAIWSIISCVLFDIMHKHEFASKFKAKLSDDLVSLLGFMYVDDNDIICKKDSNLIQELMEDSQKILSFWIKLIKVTGGAIRMDKSNWYGYYHEWSPDTGAYCMTNIQDSSLKAKDQFGVVSNLPQLTWSAPQKILGHYMSPDGENHHQVSKLIELAKSEAIVISRSRLSPVDCHLALCTSISPKILYTLVATTVSHSDSKKIFRPILDACLPKMKLVKSLGYDYIHGAKEYHGLGIPEPYHYSFGHQVEHFLEHTWHDSQTGKFMRMEFQELWIELGTSDLFDINASSRIAEGLLTLNSWLFPIRQYLINEKISLQIPTDTPSVIRERDKFVMDVIASFPYTTISKKELKDFNYCRLYKRVRTLADIVDSSGRTISVRSWSTERFSRGYESEFNSFHPPLPHQWKAWKKGLRAIGQCLTLNLGQWKVPESRLLHWDFFLDPVQRRLLLRDGDRWKSFQLLNRRWTGLLRFDRTPTLVEQEIDGTQLYRTTVIVQENTIEIENATVQETITVPSNPIALGQLTSKIQPLLQGQNLMEWITIHKDNLPDSSWALAEVRLVGEVEHILSDFIEGRAILAGDGSYKEDRGAGASIISSQDGEHYIIGYGTTPGNAEDQSPYRSELGSLIGCFLLKLLLSIATQTSPQVIISCDNDKALDISVAPKEFIRINSPHSDLISAIFDIRSASPGDIKINRVQGHSDQEKSWEEMSVLERLNSIVDVQAKICRRQSTVHVYRTARFTPGFGRITVNGAPISYSPAEAIQLKAARTRGQRARDRNNTGKNQYFYLIDQSALSKAINKTPLSRRLLLTKLASRQLPVGKVMVQRKHRLSNSCPQCKETIETVEHLFVCCGCSAINSFDVALAQFEVQLHKINTCPALSSHLVETLRLWKRGGSNLQTVYPSSIMNRGLFQAFAEQERIGWRYLFEGLISTKWAEAQKKHEDSIRYERRARSPWAPSFICAIWDLFHHIWISRNSSLHESESTLEEINGGVYLQESIEQEFYTGIGLLHKDFSRMFSKYPSVEALLRQPLQTRLAWFKTIRSARESSSSARIDAFSSNGPLRSWVGLPKITNPPGDRID